MTKRPTLLVASTGGHLSQLHQLAPRIEPDASKRVWVTFDTQQSRSMLANENVEFVRFMAPRQWLTGAKNAASAIDIYRRHKPSRVFSTGSGIALSFLPLSRLFGAHATYIESAARAQGPSVTGKVLGKLPGVQLFAQYRHYATGRWQFGYSVFDDFTPRQASYEPPTADRPRIFVMLGTLSFPFSRLVERINSHLPPEAEVVWQLGHTPLPSSGLPGKVIDFAPSTEIAAVVRESTAVICHAGCGSAITALENGVWPILVPRKRNESEHIDDHQLQIAHELSKRKLAVGTEVEKITRQMLTLDYRGRSAR